MSDANRIIEEYWRPLRTELADGTGSFVQFNCWNRTYRMNGALPEGITSNGKEVLSSPIRLHATFCGKEEPVLPSNSYVTEQTDDKTVYLHQASAGNVVLNSRVTVERDGLIWIELMVLPFTQSGVMPCTSDEAVPKLDSLTLELPISAEIAELYHYWPAANYGGLSNSGSLPEGGLALPFRPHLWIGNEEAGLSFYAESDQFWQCADPNRVLTVEKTESAAALRICLLDGMPEAWVGRGFDDWGNALEPVRFSFGLQASPVKPYRPVGDYRYVCHKGLACADPEHPYDLDAFEREADELAALGIRWRTFHEDWSMIQNYGRPKDEAMFQAKVDALHRRGIKAMVYFGYEYASCAPDFFDHGSESVVRNANGSRRGGWQRFPPQRDYIVCYAGPYSETMLERCRHAMDEYGVDGIYTDGTYVPWSCANAEHGCGWTDKNGNRHETWPLLRVREHVKKLFIQTHERGGIVEAHQSSCVIPMILAYCDCYWDGEHIALTTDPATGNYRSLTGKELIEKYTGGSGSGVGTMRAEFTGVNFGIPCQFLSYAPTFDECSGLTLLYGVLPKAGGGKDSIREASRHWKIMEKYGLTEERFVPFWREDCPIRCADSRLSCSAWNTPDGVMAVFVNLSGEAAETDFTCTVPYSEAVDLRSGTSLDGAHICLADAAPVYVFLKK